MEHVITQITNQAIMLTILISLPPILGSLAVGLLVALFSAVTQIQEQTLSFAPKMIIVYGVIAATASYLSAMLLRFALHLFTRFPEMVW